MTRPHGKPTTKAARAERQAKAAELINAGVPSQQIIAELGISRMTFWRDLQAIEARYINGSVEDVKQFKAAQLAALMRLEEATIKGEVDPTTAQALIRIRDSVAKLLGLNAETRHLRMNVNATSNPTGRAYQIAPFLHGLDDEQFADVCNYAKSLPRTPAPMPPGPPKMIEGEIK
jgi:hypothetical protein